MARRGMDKGHGKGYRNIAPMYAHDVRTHHLSGKGIKSAQRLPQLMKGDKVVSKFTQAKGQVVSTDPFAVKYQADSRDYVRLSNPKYWAKGGKIDTRFRNFAVFRVAKSPPKNARIRLQDIGRKGHSLRMAYYKDGKWHTYQFLISKADLGTPKANKLIASIKAKYHVRGGKDFDYGNTKYESARKAAGINVSDWLNMPTQEIDKIVAEYPNVEAKPSLAQRIGAGVSKAAATTGEVIKGTYKGLKGGIEEYKRKQAEKRAEEISEAKAELKPKLEKLKAQHERVETLKAQIAEQEEQGMDTSDEIGELETEMKQLRTMQEKVTDLPLEDLSDKQLKMLAVRHRDSGFLSDFFGSGNEYEDELLRRINKTKQINQKIRQAARKPVESGFF